MRKGGLAWVLLVFTFDDVLLDFGDHSLRHVLQLSRPLHLLQRFNCEALGLELLQAMSNLLYLELLLLHLKVFARISRVDSESGIDSSQNDCFCRIIERVRFFRFLFCCNFRAIFVLLALLPIRRIPRAHRRMTRIK